MVLASNVNRLPQLPDTSRQIRLFPVIFVNKRWAAAIYGFVTLTTIRSPGSLTIDPAAGLVLTTVQSAASTT
jgi:hypothetical protein